MVAGVVSAILIMVSAAWEVFFVVLRMDFRTWSMKWMWVLVKFVVWLMEFSVGSEKYFREGVGFMLVSLYICGRIVWNLLQVGGMM